MQQRRSPRPRPEPGGNDVRGEPRQRPRWAVAELAALSVNECSFWEGLDLGQPPPKRSAPEQMMNPSGGNGSPPRRHPQVADPPPPLLTSNVVIGMAGPSGSQAQRPRSARGRREANSHPQLLSLEPETLRHRRSQRTHPITTADQPTGLPPNDAPGLSRAVAWGRSCRPRAVWRLSSRSSRCSEKLFTAVS
jgi:hypothetical protein